MRHLKTLAWVVALGLAAPMFHQAVAAEPSAAALQEDEVALYTLFLFRWTDQGTGKTQVASKPREPSPDDLRQYAECTAGQQQWVAGQSTTDFAEGLGKLRYVHLVDPETWKATDPRALIGRGKSVEDAVQAGFDHGLLTLSALRYDPTHHRAAMTYAFVCGSLCGNGGVVLFEKTNTGWKESRKDCGGWMS